MIGWKKGPLKLVKWHITGDWYSISKFKYWYLLDQYELGTFYCTETLCDFLKWFFALDKYNYSRWATVYWFDLATLDQCCWLTLFSRIALDQLHEQNNKVIKGISGTNRKDESALNRWALSGPELAEIISQFQNEYEQNDQSLASTKDYHERRKAFQTDFYHDVQGLRRNFVNNSFHLGNLTVINDTSQLFDDNIFPNIAKLESIGLAQLKAVINDRLISCKTYINSKIALNHFILLNDKKSKKPHGQTADKCLTIQFLTKLRDTVRNRLEKAEMLLSTEIFGISQCLSKQPLPWNKIKYTTNI